MTEGDALQELFLRPITEADLPIIIERKQWANFASWLIIIMLAGAGIFIIWLAPSAKSWGVHLLYAIGGTFFAIIPSMISKVGRYAVIINMDGVHTGNRFVKYFFAWQEIKGVRIWITRNQVGGRTASLVLDVDGSRNRRRPLENLFLFSGYYLPGLLELDAFKFEKLLAKTRRQLKRPKPKQVKRGNGRT